MTDGAQVHPCLSAGTAEPQIADAGIRGRECRRQRKMRVQRFACCGCGCGHGGSVRGMKNTKTTTMAWLRLRESESRAGRSGGCKLPACQPQGSSIDKFNIAVVLDTVRIVASLAGGQDYSIVCTVVAAGYAISDWLGDRRMELPSVACPRRVSCPHSFHPEPISPMFLQSRYRDTMQIHLAQANSLVLYTRHFLRAQMLPSDPNAINHEDQAVLE